MSTIRTYIGRALLYHVYPIAGVPNVYKVEDLLLVAQDEEQMCAFGQGPLPLCLPRGKH